MPCTQTGSIEGDQLLAANSSNKELVEENTKLTQMLCEACAILEKQDIHNSMTLDYTMAPPSVIPKEVAKWWQKHKQIDAERIRREQEQQAKYERKKALLEKLTPEELALIKEDWSFHTK